MDTSFSDSLLLQKVYYPQEFLEEYKCKVNWRLTEDLTDFDSYSGSNSDSEINKMKLIMKLHDTLINLD